MYYGGILELFSEEGNLLPICVQPRPRGLGWTQPRHGGLKEGIWVDSDNISIKNLGLRHHRPARWVRIVNRYVDDNNIVK